LERTATFGAGCFWGVEAAFREVEGVTRTRVGYGGGTLDHPSYEDVCARSTGHAEVVEVTYDPQRVSYDELLAVFWRKHNPTRRGGGQYRSVVFFHDAEQQHAALASKAQEQARLDAPVVTDIVPVPTFYEAEERHQQYLEKRGRAKRAAEFARAR
jgi:peptide-methionine (S)-S-oxide reductase